MMLQLSVYKTGLRSGLQGVQWDARTTILPYIYMLLGNNGFLYEETSTRSSATVLA